MPADWTGTLVLLLRFYRRATWILTPFCTCVSVRRLGRCTRTPQFISFRCRVSFGFLSLQVTGWPFVSLVSSLSVGCPRSVGRALFLTALTDCRWWFDSLLVRVDSPKGNGLGPKKKVFLVRCLFPGGVLGPYLAACYLLRPALVVPSCPVFFGLCASFVVSSWCCGFLLAFGCCGCLFLGCLVRLCFWCVRLLRLGSLSPGFVPPLLCPPRLVLWCLLVQSVFCWSLPLGMRRSGCLPVAWCVVTLAVFTSPHGAPSLSCFAGLRLH